MKMAVLPLAVVQHPNTEPLTHCKVCALRHSYTETPRLEIEFQRTLGSVYWFTAVFMGQGVSRTPNALSSNYWKRNLRLSHISYSTRSPGGRLCSVGKAC
jgi:hypothetical protein